jgi:hypothetical protein
MNKSDELNEKIWQILRYLVVEIGPRPAGSPSEQQALDWLEQQFTDANLKTTRCPVKFQPEALFFPYYSLAAIGFLLAGFVLPTNGWLCLILLIQVLILPEGALWLQKKLLPFKDGSGNLIVLPDSIALEQVDLLFCAHLDSARAVPVGPRLWKKWRAEIFYTMMRAGLLLVIIGGMQSTGFEIPEIVISLGQIIAFGMAAMLVIQDLWEQISSWGKFTPGANDNASGVSVLTALALTIAKTPPKTLKIGFLFSGAEECGLQGASQFANELSKINHRPMVISVDMVGAGSKLRIITRSGTLFPVKTNSGINELIKRADPLAEFHAAPRRWGDFVPFIKAGIPASHIENSGTPLSWATYHTENDDLDVIDPDMLEHVGEVLAQVIWILDKNK